MKSGLSVLLAFLLCLGMVRVAAAHDGATGVVKQRMDAMREMKNHVKVIGEMLNGKKYLSRKRLQILLSRIEKASGPVMTKLFPKGSHGHPSEADPALWKSWQDFTAMAGTLATVSGDFSRSATQGGDKNSLDNNYVKLRAACKACHDRFRQ